MWHFFLRFNVHLYEIKKVIYGLDDELKCPAVRIADYKSGQATKRYVAQKLRSGVIVFRGLRG
ncbi:MAG: hypothetical protein CMK30_03480 [Porticoccaceae bacterium]|nr:hypothetical protein [Porticoccaceae bacterium]